jgi:hypothetical protein
MTLPPLPLIRLHLNSRQTPRALILLIAIAVVLRASHPLTKDTNLFSQVTLMLITVAAAAIIAAGTRTPFGEPEHTASSSLPALRLTHLATLTATTTATLAIAAWTATYGMSAAVILRNVTGLTGIALLTAALLGAHLAWTAPLGYVMYCGGQLDVQVSNLWTWPTQPANNHTAAAIAAVLLVAGITAITITGARDHRTDPS